LGAAPDLMPTKHQAMARRQVKRSGRSVPVTFNPEAVSASPGSPGRLAAWPPGLRACGLRVCARCRLNRLCADALPLVLIDGQQALAGRYPTRAQLALWSAASIVNLHPDSGDCCSGGHCG